MRRLLVAGFSLLAISALLLTRVPAGGHFATDLLPALLLAGVAGGLSAPAIQIGALSGVTRSMTGLASGLVETMREIGGAIGVAAVSTVLVSRRRPDRGRVPSPAARAAGGGGRFPRRVLGDIRRRGPGRADRRDCLSVARHAKDRGRPRRGVGSVPANG